MPLAQQWGGLLAVNYAARPFGVKRGMRVEEALRLCPQLRTPHVRTIGGDDDGDGAADNDRAQAKVSPLREASQQIFALIESHAPVLERASVDEAYVDVADLVEAEELSRVDREPGMWAVAAGNGAGEWKPDRTDCFDVRLVAAAAVCERLRMAVKERLGFDVSAGIAHTKMLAKLASARHKPNRQTVVPRRAVGALLSSVPLRSVRGLGGKLGEQVANALPQVDTVAALGSVAISELSRHFDRATAEWLHALGTGELDEPVRPCRAPKSLNALKSFAPTADAPQIRRWLQLLAAELLERCAADERQWHRAPATLKVQWRGELRRDHLSNWTAGRVGELTRESSRQAPMPPAGRRHVDALVEVAMRLLLAATDGANAQLPTLTRLGLSCVEFTPLAATSIASMLRDAAPTTETSSSGGSAGGGSSSAGGGPASAGGGSSCGSALGKGDQQRSRGAPP